MDSPSHPTIHEQKHRLRREVLERRDALSTADRMRLGEQIALHLMAQPKVRAATTVFLYLTFHSEVPTEPILKALADEGKRICVPHMTAGVRTFVAAEYLPGESLEPGPYRVLQPVRLRPVPTSALDVVLAPGVAFDRSGGRMGYGKGYYDRFLADPYVKAWVAGLAFGLQVVDRLPVEPHDRRMDALFSENGSERVQP